MLLAKLLLEKPDILLLDEPTNYLDEEHIAWLKRYLQEYENAFILISHDIPFLNDVINIVYHMENQELNRYVGDYDHFQEVYEVKKAQLEAAYRRQQHQDHQQGRHAAAADGFFLAFCHVCGLPSVHRLQVVENTSTYMYLV